MPSTQTLAFVGLVLAGYAIYVEYRHHNEAEEETPFLALCDIEVIGASCRSVLYTYDHQSHLL